MWVALLFWLYHPISKTSINQELSNTHDEKDFRFNPETNHGR